MIVVFMRPAWQKRKMRNTKDEKNKAGKRNLEQSKLLLHMIQENRGLLEHIACVYEVDYVRISLLKHIFLELGDLEKQDKVRDDIYRYGSMIKGDELLARQLFLWLAEMAEAVSL